VGKYNNPSSGMNCLILTGGCEKRNLVFLEPVAQKKGHGISIIEMHLVELVEHATEEIKRLDDIHRAVEIELTETGIQR